MFSVEKKRIRFRSSVDGTTEKLLDMHSTWSQILKSLHNVRPQLSCILGKRIRFRLVLVYRMGGNSLPPPHFSYHICNTCRFPPLFITNIPDSFVRYARPSWTWWLTRWSWFGSSGVLPFIYLFILKNEKSYLFIRMCLRTTPFESKDDSLWNSQYFMSSIPFLSGLPG